MTFSSIRLFKGVVPNTITPIYTVTTGETVVIKNIFIDNKDSVLSSNLSIYVAKSGDLIDDSNVVISNLTYTAKQKENINDLFLVLEAGDIVYAKQSEANALNVYVSGVLQK